MKKRVSTFSNKPVYLLGKDADDKLYWLVEPSFDCDWYWGIGYVQSYSNNNPERARDCRYHDHFSCMFLDYKAKAFERFQEFFVETPFSDKEIWQILELMQSMYTAREYSDMLHRGGAHFTSNPCQAIIKSQQEYDRINNEVIPSLAYQLRCILSGREA